MYCGVMLEIGFLPNDEASHAGPLALDWNGDALPALAEPIC
jgi:hypothetical protein